MSNQKSDKFFIIPSEEWFKKNKNQPKKIKKKKKRF